MTDAPIGPSLSAACNAAPVSVFGARIADGRTVEIRPAGLDMQGGRRMTDGLHGTGSTVGSATGDAFARLDRIDEDRPADRIDPASAARDERTRDEPSSTDLDQLPTSAGGTTDIEPVEPGQSIGRVPDLDDADVDEAGDRAGPGRGDPTA
jgi:hypothetical protein